MNDYPHESDLEKIRNWHHSDFIGMIDFIETIYPHYGFIKRTGKKIQRVIFVTGGWSGCEDIIRAMEDNKDLFSMVCWEASFRGGKHIYRVRNIV